MLMRVTLVVMILIVLGGCATYKIVTKPDKAEIYQYSKINEDKVDVDIESFDKKRLKYMGDSPYTLTINPKLYQVVIQARKPGYYDSRLYTNVDLKNNELQIQLEKDRSFLITSTPDNAVINMDDDSKFSNPKVVGEAPLRYKPQEDKGMLYFQAANNDYEKSEIIPYHLGEHNEDINIELGNRVVKKGSILIECSEKNFEISIDKTQTKNVSGQQFSDFLSEGLHSFSISKKDFKTVNFNMDVKPNQQNRKSIVLEKIEYGYIKLTSNESNVDIYLDNEHIGVIKDGLPLNKKVITGNHTISAKKDFFMPNTIKIHIPAKEVFPHHFELVKATGWLEQKPSESDIVQATGTLTIATERSNLVVYIEGAKKIPTFFLDNVPAGIYNIRIVGENIDETIEIVIDDGEDVFIDLDERFFK